MFHRHDHRYHHRHPSFADTGVGVVIAAEFRKMCLPRNPTTTTPSTSATTSVATAVIRHSPPSACLNLPHHLVHRWVVFHESKRCIDCADAMNQGAARQARADSTRPVPSGPFRRPSFVLAVVEAVQGCRLGRALVRGRPRFRSLIIAFGSRFRRRHI